MDIKVVFDIVENEFGKDVIYRTETPYVTIYVGEDTWGFEVCDSRDYLPSPDRSLYVLIDAKNGEIIEYEDEGWLVDNLVEGWSDYLINDKNI